MASYENPALRNEPIQEFSVKNVVLRSKSGFIILGISPAHSNSLIAWEKRPAPSKRNKILVDLRTELKLMFLIKKNKRRATPIALSDQASA